MIDYLYSGNDLGANYFENNTYFKLWAPNAILVKVIIYDNYYEDYGKVFIMDKNEFGIWHLNINGNYSNKYYNYLINIDGVEKQTPDPYTKGATINGTKGMIVDFNSLNPKGWDNQLIPSYISPTESIIYEMHIRDFSIDNSSGLVNKGKYLALTEDNIKNSCGVYTGISHLKELGVTHVHLLPVYDFISVDERENDSYNWGYDPYLFNALEGSYSTNPYDGRVRIVEFKKMIKALHSNNIRVILDVVYNHTFKNKENPFEIIYPEYYYRYDDNNEASDGSGCGNELATEKPMVRKFIIDSLKFWVSEYKIDGFRFDLMNLYDTETIRQIEAELKNLKPSILLYGEPWIGGKSSLNKELAFEKGRQKGLKVGLFNDDFRNAIKGDNDGFELGFVNGGLDFENEIKKGITGSIAYSNSISGFALNPSESINYVSSHDNLTLYDKIEKTSIDMTKLEKEMVNRLALSIVLTSIGVPFIHSGSEFLRTKKGNHNSYNASDEINALDWNRKKDYFETFRYIAELISFRKSQSILMSGDYKEIVENLSFIDTPQNVIGYILNCSQENIYKQILIIHNANRKEVVVNLEQIKEWVLICDGNKVSKAGIKSYGGLPVNCIQVKPLSTHILAKLS